MFEVLNILLKLLVTCNGNYYIIIPVKHEYVVQKVMTASDKSVLH